MPKNAYPVHILYVIASRRVKSGFVLFLIQMAGFYEKFVKIVCKEYFVQTMREAGWDNRRISVDYV